MRQGLYRAVILRALQDATSPGERLRDDAISYLKGAGLSKDIQNAGYPAELLDTIGEILQRSGVQRNALLRDLCHLLTTKRE